MRNKILIAFFLSTSLTNFAQKFSNSPYSSLGIGEYGNMDHALFNGVGNSTTAFIDSTTLNYFNPSSYGRLGFGQPLFSTGISSRFSQFSSNNETFNGKYIGLNHFAFAISVFKRFGLAAGLKPFSRTGYEFFQSELLGTDSIKYVYKGSGTTNHAFLGVSATLLNFKHHKLAVGSNIGYVFGSSLNERKAYITTNGSLSGGVEQIYYKMNSLHLDFGMHYELSFLKSNRLILAATYTPEQALTATRNEILSFSKNVDNPNFYETVLSLVDDKGSITLPSTMGLGFSYSFRPRTGVDFNKNKVYEITILGDYSSSNWSNYRMEFANEQSSNLFENTSRFSGGIQYTPHFDYLDRATTIGFMSRVRYRAGFQYATLPIVSNSVQQKDFGITFGLGLPIATQRSSTSINVGFIAGKRGDGLVQSVNERYLGVNVGVIISPGIYDRWFRKFKID
jgi:hypothetical protein